VGVGVYQEADGPIVTGEHATVAIELLDPELIQTASAAVDLDTVTRRFIGDLCEEALEDGSHESDLSTQAMVVAGSVRSFCHCQLPGVRAGGRGGRGGDLVESNRVLQEHTSPSFCTCLLDEEHAPHVRVDENRVSGEEDLR
jgi:hypothetical protein